MICDAYLEAFAEAHPIDWLACQRVWGIITFAAWSGFEVLPSLRPHLYSIARGAFQREFLREAALQTGHEERAAGFRIR